MSMIVARSLSDLRDVVDLWRGESLSTAVVPTTIRRRSASEGFMTLERDLVETRRCRDLGQGDPGRGRRQRLMAERAQAWV